MQYNIGVGNDSWPPQAGLQWIRTCQQSQEGSGGPRSSSSASRPPSPNSNISPTREFLPARAPTRQIKRWISLRSHITSDNRCEMQFQMPHKKKTMFWSAGHLEDIGYNLSRALWNLIFFAGAWNLRREPGSSRNMRRWCNCWTGACPSYLGVLRRVSSCLDVCVAK